MNIVEVVKKLIEKIPVEEYEKKYLQLGMEETEELIQTLRSYEESANYHYDRYVKGIDEDGDIAAMYFIELMETV